MRHVFQAVPIQADVYCGHTWAAKEAKENRPVSVFRFQSRLRFGWQCGARSHRPWRPLWISLLPVSH
jgi:hypothetical protein